MDDEEVKEEGSLEEDKEEDYQAAWLRGELAAEWEAETPEQTLDRLAFYKHAADMCARAEKAGWYVPAMPSNRASAPPPPPPPTPPGTPPPTSMGDSERDAPTEPEAEAKVETPEEEKKEDEEKPTMEFLGVKVDPKISPSQHKLPSTKQVPTPVDALGRKLIDISKTDVWYDAVRSRWFRFGLLLPVKIIYSKELVYAINIEYPDWRQRATPQGKANVISWARRQVYWNATSVKDARWEHDYKVLVGSVHVALVTGKMAERLWAANNNCCVRFWRGPVSRRGTLQRAIHSGRSINAPTHLSEKFARPDPHTKVFVATCTRAREAIPVQALGFSIAGMEARLPRADQNGLLVATLRHWRAQTRLPAEQERTVLDKMEALAVAKMERLGLLDTVDENSYPGGFKLPHLVEREDLAWANQVPGRTLDKAVEQLRANPQFEGANVRKFMVKTELYNCVDGGDVVKDHKPFRLIRFFKEGLRMYYGYCMHPWRKMLSTLYGPGEAVVYACCYNGERVIDERGLGELIVRRSNAETIFRCEDISKMDATVTAEALRLQHRVRERVYRKAAPLDLLELTTEKAMFNDANAPGVGVESETINRASGDGDTTGGNNDICGMAIELSLEETAQHFGVPVQEVGSAIICGDDILGMINEAYNEYYGERQTVNLAALGLQATGYQTNSLYEAELVNRMVVPVETEEGVETYVLIPKWSRAFPKLGYSFQAGDPARLLYDRARAYQLLCAGVDSPLSVACDHLVARAQRAISKREDRPAPVFTVWPPDYGKFAHAVENYTRPSGNLYRATANTWEAYAAHARSIGAMCSGEDLRVATRDIAADIDEGVEIFHNRLLRAIIVAGDRPRE
jgi:hypothetical protein